MFRLRRLRAVLVLAIASGMVWVPLGFAVSTIDSLLAGRGFPRVTNLIGQIPLLLMVGTVCGFLFSLGLAVGARKQTFAALTLPRVSVLGAIGAATLPLALAFADTGSIRVHGMLSALAIYGTVGALTACGLLALARRAPDTDKLVSPPTDTPHDRINAGTA